MIIKISISDSAYIDDVEKEFDIMGGNAEEADLCDEVLDYLANIHKLIVHRGKIESEVLHDCHAQGEDGHCEHPSHLEKHEIYYK